MTKIKQIQTAVLASALVVFAEMSVGGARAFAAANVAAPVPASQQSPWWAGEGYWNRRHAAKLAEIAAGPKDYDFVFVGDSITHNWEGWSDPVDCAAVEKAYKNGQLKFPNGPGRKVWEEMKGEFRLLNLGCGGDTTANVLWRLEHGELDGYRARGFGLMIGTNNGEDGEAVAKGIAAIVRTIRDRHPESTVVLMPIFPCRELPTASSRIRNADVDWRIQKLVDGERVVWLDFNDDFLEPDGRLSAVIMPDYLHPLEPGYRIWRSAIEPVIRRLAHFKEAKPVWPVDQAERMNDNVRFRGVFAAPSAGTSCLLELTGSTCYRVHLNGKFIGYGPARGPKGMFRVDRLDLTKALSAGENRLEIDVHGANVNSYEYMDQPSFLQAELVSDGKVLLATGTRSAAFEAVDTHERVRKVPRFSYQRLFSEAYRIGEKGVEKRLRLEEQPRRDLLMRDATLPSFPMDETFVPVARLCRRYDATAAVERPRYQHLIGREGFKCYPNGELEVDVTSEMQKYVVDRAGAIASTLWRGSKLDAGFVVADVVCTKPGRLVMFVSEVGSSEKGAIPYRQGNDATGAVIWDIVAPGVYTLETFNPTSVRYVETFMHGGAAEVKGVRVREYKNAAVLARPYAGGDPDLGRIYAAAAESLAQNCVDVFADCPGRERAAWIGDSFFTARAAHFLAGSTAVEKTFLGNFALARGFDDIPVGQFPMVYPGDHPKRDFIPNYSMWLVLQLAEYAQRGGDRGLVMKMRPKVLALIRELRSHRNADGLLANLPGWVFVGWDLANALTKGVNYPSNMQYAGTLAAVSRLYGDPTYADEACGVRARVRAASWNGTWFRDCDWCDDTTETCQYYAFFFGVAERTRDAALWDRLVTTCGSRRKPKVDHPELHPSNTIFGKYLRYTLLAEAGESERLAHELKAHFLPMAKKTGTLWEHTDDSGSLSHGLASYAAVLVDLCSGMKSKGGSRQ